MRTLLSLFFVPYLRFLGKFHLYALPVMALVFLVRIPELMVLAPMIYMFALYTTMNRHQFKENIPWMLATFNKRTLVRYHLFAQTLVIACQAICSSVVLVSFFVVMILVAPESSDQVLPEMGTGKGAGALLSKGMSPLAGTKEQLVLAVVALFFLITMYSPVALKDYLRQLEERQGRKSQNKQILQFAVGAIFSAVLVYLNPAQWLGPLLSFILVAEIAYVVWMFNRAFALFHPRYYNRGLMVSATAAVLVAVGVHTLSSHRFHHAASSEARLTELGFMGALAPKISPEEFTAIAREVKDPSFIMDMLAEPRFAKLITATQLQTWMGEAKELSVALRLVKTLPPAELVWLEKPAPWNHLEKLFSELHARNPASASWQAKTFERHLVKQKWHPPGGATLAGRGPLQQLVILGVWQKQSPDLYRTAVAKDIHPLTQSLHWDEGTRAPASMP